MKLQNLIGTIVVAASLLSAAACAPQQATSAPTVEPSTVAVEAPTETFEPFPTDTETPSVTETAEPTQEGTGQPGTGVTQPASGGAAGVTAAPITAGTAADKYAYISQTLPDGYQVRPDTQVTIAWSVKNTGTTAWDTNYSLRYFAGPQVKNTYVAFPKIVSANTTTTLTVTFTTPAQPGEYDLWYKMTNALSQNFGDLDFKFTVTNTPNNNAKPAPTATKTP